MNNQTELDMKWKVHLPNLVIEILKNPGTHMLVQPLHIMKMVMGEIAETASEQQNYEIMSICGRLALYEQCDPDVVGAHVAGENIKQLEALAANGANHE